jgi:NAD(P)-dependent dehydrogenase (short-subunit alcohol dehydrogenase family)
MSQTAIVTGASSGIGLEVARRLLKNGAHVVLGGRDRQKLAAAVDDLAVPDRTAVVDGDIADPATAERLVGAALELSGRLDLLVNNAGLFEATPFTDVAPTELDGFIAVNLRGTWQVTQAVVRQLIAQGEGGSIVNIGTVLNQHAITGFPAAAPLVTKGGVQALTVALAAELAPHRIRVNMVAPGIVRTSLHPADQVDNLAVLAVLDRVGEADEIAESVTWLAGAEFVTGHVLNVDGGFVAGRR